MIAAIQAIIKVAMGGLFGWKTVAIGAGVAFAAGVFAGGWGVYQLWDVSASHAQIATLKKQNQAMQEAARQDAPRALADALQMRKLKEEIRVLQSKIPDGPGLSAGDVDGLRKLWGYTGASANPRRSKGVFGFRK